MPETVTIITGAANGIAHQLARDLLARGGHRLILCDARRWPESATRSRAWRCVSMA